MDTEEVLILGMEQEIFVPAPSVPEVFIPAPTEEVFILEPDDS